jgi:hypothetical protein
MPARNTIGMAVPGASALMDAPSISDQVAGETAEQRRKRLQAMQAAQKLPAGISSLAPDYGAAMSMS